MSTFASKPASRKTSLNLFDGGWPTCFT